MYYANVQQMIFFGNGHDTDLMELDKLSSKRARFIAKFWRTRALLSAGDYPKTIVDRYSRQANKGTSEETKAIVDKVQQDMSFVFYSYYYDHWTEINDMIVKTLAYVKEHPEETEVRRAAPAGP